MHQLEEKQKRFVQEYLIDLNATAAAGRAGYKDPNYGRQLLTKPNVLAEIQRQQNRIRNNLEITQERVVRELAAVGFANFTDFVAVTDDGALAVTPTEQVPPDKLPAVACIKATAAGVEIKLHDKVRALELLGKHLGVFDSGRTDAAPANNLLEALEAAASKDVDTDDLPEIQ